MPWFSSSIFQEQHAIIIIQHAIIFLYSISKLRRLWRTPIIVAKRIVLMILITSILSGATWYNLDSRSVLRINYNQTHDFLPHVNCCAFKLECWKGTSILHVCWVLIHFLFFRVILSVEQSWPISRWECSFIFSPMNETFIIK